MPWAAEGQAKCDPQAVLQMNNHFIFQMLAIYAGNDNAQRQQAEEYIVNIGLQGRDTKSTCIVLKGVNRGVNMPFVIRM